MLKANMVIAVAASSACYRTRRVTLCGEGKEIISVIIFVLYIYI